MIENLVLGENDMRILFIGNSYTFQNDMPVIFQRLAQENGISVEVDEITKGGRYLSANNDPEDPESIALRSLISENHYDVCFIQEQSVRPVLETELFLDSVIKTMDLLKDSCDRFLLYETWGRKEGSTMLEKIGMTSDKMYRSLFSAYRKASEATGCALSRAGYAFWKMIGSYPDIELYRPDRSHPSYVGSCLVAICHFCTVFGKFPEKCESLYLSERVLTSFRLVIESIPDADA